MNFSTIKRIFAFLIVAGLFFGFSADSRRIMAHMESEKLIAGKKVIIRGDVFYSQSDGRMVVHYTYPQDYFFVSNTKGEVQLYLPEANQVMIQRNPVLSSQNDVLYYFLSNKISDLGLKDAGFELTETKVEDRNVITTWTPPAPASKTISKVEMVHQDFVPIYTAYFDLKEKITKKIYYAKYLQTSESMLPQLITEIEYIPTGDSIISRKKYSDIKTGFSAQSQYFDFSVPGDAKLITFDENFGR
jgi:hypothetical protein